MVRRDISTSNDPPKYPDQSTLTGVSSPTTDSPTQGRTVADRFIRETAAAGDIVGAPVTAFDDDATIDILTYSLRDPVGTTGPNHDGFDDLGDVNIPIHKDGHAANFDIDPESGQITVHARARLDADGVGNPPYEVVVRAVDADGDDEDITVFIHVLEIEEPPKINRVYTVDEPTNESPTDVTSSRYSMGDRVPTEITHWEWDRTREFRSPTELDADLDTSVLEHSDGKIVYGSTTPYPAMGEEDNLQPAVYTASDEDGDVIDWSLEGPDKGSFVLLNIISTGGDIVSGKKKLAFKDKEGFPDFENPEDKNKDNVYEVTLVVEDSTVDKQGKPHKDELNVTVKVINSTEDNEPGKLTITNRQPEVNTVLTAVLTDPDTVDTTEAMAWQWYRAADPSPSANTAGEPDDGAACTAITPTASNPNNIDTVDERRHFLESTSPGASAWTAISGANSHEYTPVADDLGHCLRVAVAYSDAAGDPTSHDDPTTPNDEGLEATYAGTEWPVKKEDTENDAPIFTVDGATDSTTGAVEGEHVPQYRESPISGDGYTASKVENTDVLHVNGVYDSTDNIITTEGFFPATDTSVDEDDFADEDATDPTYDATGNRNDRLTYSLSGPHASSFRITGSVDYNSVVTGTLDDTDDPDGRLEFKKSPDYEAQNEYRVTVKATDPTGDFKYVNVRITITNVNEVPKRGKPAGISDRVPYPENATKVVSTYEGKDPESPTFIYSLVDTTENLNLGITRAADMDPDLLNGTAATATITAADIADQALFEIDSNTGELRFKASPNYEDPKDSADAGATVSGTEDPRNGETVAAADENDNVYHVTVKAEVLDQLSPRDAVFWTIKVTVANVNEKPVFPKATDTRKINENPDDPNKEPDRYLLNRGVGTPIGRRPDSAQPGRWETGGRRGRRQQLRNPQDYTGDDFIRGPGAYTETANPQIHPIQMIDGLIYELIGTDAAAFEVVPATGQILTQEKLDYEIKNEYRFKVKATDPWGLSDTMDLTIEVENLDRGAYTPGGRG